VTRPVPAPWLVRVLRRSPVRLEEGPVGGPLTSGRPEMASPIGADAFLATVEQYEGCPAEVLDAARERGSRGEVDDVD
jgi:hypothetical protein